MIKMCLNSKIISNKKNITEKREKEADKEITDSPDFAQLYLNSFNVRRAQGICD